MTRKRDRWLATAAAVALLGTVAACAPSSGAGDASANGGGSASANSGGGDVSLTVWGWRPEDTAAYTKIFDAYHQSHPNVTVEYKPYKSTEYNTILSTGLSQAGGPDVMMLRAYGALQPLVEAGDLVPLDDKVDALKSFPKEALGGATGKKDGKVYGVPTAMQTFQILYNKKIFADNGLSVPKTWDDLLATAKKLKDKGITPFAASGKDSWLLPLYDDTFGATRYGGPDFEQAVLSGKKDFTDPNYVAALKILGDLKPYFPDGMLGMGESDVQTLFATGKAAMIPEGSFAVGPITKIKSDIDLGAFPAPPAPDAVVDHPLAVGWVDMSFGVNAKSTHQQQALDLVKWMATKDFGQMYTDEVKQISLVPGTEPSVPVLKDMVSTYRANPTPYLMLVDFRYGTPLGSDLEAAGLQNMLLGKQTAPQVAADIQKGISQWFKPGQ